jgi:hypothetical protein
MIPSPDSKLKLVVPKGNRMELELRRVILFTRNLEAMGRLGSDDDGDRG